jgi:putative ABC transport system permease protein
VLIKGTKTSVKAALNDYGIPQSVGKGNSKRAMPLSKLPGTFILALRNSWRNSRRLTVTVITMALGVAIFSTGFNVRKSLSNLLSNLRNELRYDVQVALSKQVTKEEAVRTFKDISGIKGIYTWNGGAGAVQTSVLSTNKGAGIISLPCNTKLIKPKITKGRWIQQSVETEVVMNQQAWQLYGFPEIGTNLILAIDDSAINVKIVGLAEQFELGKIFIDTDKYDSVFNPEHLVNTISFVAINSEYENVIELKKKIERAIVPSGLNVLFVQANVERVKVIYDHLNIILSTIVILSFLVLLVSAVGMASSTSINIGERTREIGVMRAIGATPKKIYSLFTNEGMIISVGSIIIGLVLAYPLSRIAAVFFGKLMLGEHAVLQYAFSQTGFFITLIITLLFGWFASRLPVANAVSKISTREALAYE